MGSSSANQELPFGDRRVGIVGVAWITVFVLLGIGALYDLLLFWNARHTAGGAHEPVFPILSVTLDFLVSVWLLLPGLLFFALLFAAIVTCSAFFGSLKNRVGNIRRTTLAIAAVFAVLGTLATGALNAASLLASAARSAMCVTTTFERSASPNGRYLATVVQLDCGAMSTFNRQVLVTRIPFAWTAQSLMYFHGEPTLHLTWSGRTLIIQGQESVSSMIRPPPDPMVWGGIMARYVGPAN